MSWIAWLHKPCQEKSIRNIQEMHLLRDQDISFCPPAPLFFFKKAVGVFFSLYWFTFCTAFHILLTRFLCLSLIWVSHHCLCTPPPRPPPPMRTHPQTHTVHSFFFFSLKFHLPGFIFHDTLSVCITLIQHPHRSLRTLCCQTPYL